MPSDPGPNQTPPSAGKPRRRPNPPMGGNWIWLLVLFLGVMFVWAGLPGNRGTIDWSDFIRLVYGDYLKQVTQNGDRYEGEIADLDRLPTDLKERIKSKK